MARRLKAQLLVRTLVKRSLERRGPQMALRRTEACGPLLVVDDDASLRAFRP